MSWIVSSIGRLSDEELARLDPTTGRVDAERSLGGSLDSIVVHGRSVFAVVTTPSGAWLLRLNANTLGFEDRRRLASAQPYSFGSVVVIGDGLWAAGGSHLVRLSLSMDRVTASVSVNGAATWRLATDTAENTLVVSEAESGGLARIQRRDPVSGKLLASTPPLDTVGGLGVGGVIGGKVWTAYATGMRGAVERFSLHSMKPPDCALGTTDTCVQGLNSISALVSHGLLWVSGAELSPDGPLTDYCANPISGKAQASFSLPSGDDLIAVGDDVLFIVAEGSDTVSEMAIPVGCLLSAG
jgi:hypothetical protein